MSRRARAIALLLGLTLLRVSAQDAAIADQAVFMGYNLKNYLKMDRRINGEQVVDAPKPEHEVAAVVQMILKGQPDILGLVEIGTEEDVRDLQTRLKAGGLDLPHTTLNRAFDEDRRTALLSRFPIKETDHQTALTYQIGETKMPFKRGILDATVTVNPDYHLRILGTHLKSKREIPEADQALMRRHEAHLVRKHAEAILAADPETNLLLFGDFNDTRNEMPIKAIQGKYGTDGYLWAIKLEDDLGYTWTYNWRYADQYSRFDYLFVSPQLLTEVIRDKSFIVADPSWDTASDHRPVVTTITAKNLKR